jgi:hypothetical protein
LRVVVIADFSCLQVGQRVSPAHPYIRATITVPRSNEVARRPAFGMLMPAARDDTALPELYKVKQGGSSLQYPEELFNEIVCRLRDFNLGVRRDEAARLTNLVLALRDAIISCEGHDDMPLPDMFADFSCMLQVN